MDHEALRLAANLGGTVLSGNGGSLVLVERQRGHGLPTLLVLGARAIHLLEALEGFEAFEGFEGNAAGLNLCAVLPAPGCNLIATLAFHRRRLGSLVAALDASLPWLDGTPMLAKRLPGRVFMRTIGKLEKTPLAPLEKEELKSFLGTWEKERRNEAFRRGFWDVVEGGFETRLWPGVALPEGAEIRVPPLELPTVTPLMEALRMSLRGAFGQPIPLLPLPADPSGLHALRQLTPNIAAFRGPAEAWRLAFGHLADLPAPPHFCARC